MDGQETEIPTLIPGLTQEEIKTLLTTTDPKKIPKSIVDKAIAHARGRMSAGLSPFAEPAPPDLSQVEGVPIRVPAPDIAPTFVPSVHSPDPDEIDGIMARLGETGAQFGVDVAKEFSDVGNLAAANVNRSLAAFSDSMDSVADLFEAGLVTSFEFFGLDPSLVKKGDVFKVATEELRRGEKYWRDRVQDPGLIAEILGGFLGGTIPAVGEFMLNVPWYFLKGMGQGYRATGSKAKAVKEGIKQSIHRWMLGHILHGAGFLKMPSRVVSVGTVGALDAAAAGGDPKEIAESFGVMALIGLTMGPGRVGVYEALRDARFDIPETAREFEGKIYERLRPVIENTTQLGPVDVDQITDAYSKKLWEYKQILDRGIGVPGLGGRSGSTIAELRNAGEQFQLLTGQMHPKDPRMTDPLSAIPEEAFRFPTTGPEILREPFEMVPPFTPLRFKKEAGPPPGEGFVMVEPEAPAILRPGERPTEIKQPEEPILSKEGTPFKTERGARLNIPKAQGAYPPIKDWEVVPVEDGFGLMPRHAVPWVMDIQEYTERFYLQGRRFEDVPDEEFEIIGKQPGISDFYDPKTTNWKEAVRRYIEDRVDLQREFGGILRKEHPFKKRKDGTPRIETITMKHYREVAKAVKAGLPVPQEVRAEYPALRGELVPEGVTPPEEVEPGRVLEAEEFDELVGDLLRRNAREALGELVEIPPGYPDPIIVDENTIRTDYQNVATSLRLEEIYTEAGFTQVAEDMNNVGDIDRTFEWIVDRGGEPPYEEEVGRELAEEAARKPRPFPFKVGDTVQTPSGEGKILSIGNEKARVALIDGTTEAIALGDISTPIPREEAELPVEEVEPEIEPVTPPEPELPVEEELGPVLGKDKKGKDLRAGDHVTYNQYPGKRFEVVRILSEDRPDILKVKQVGMKADGTPYKQEFNAHVSNLIKITPTIVKPEPPYVAPKPTTRLGWFKENPVWDENLKGETRQFHSKESGVPGLVSKSRGLPWDELAMKAKEDGILKEDQGVNDLMEIMQEEIKLVKAGKEPTLIGDLSDHEKEVDRRLRRAEADWIAEVATTVVEETYGPVELEVGDKVNVPTAQGDSEWVEVTKKNKDSSVELTYSTGETQLLELFDEIEIVGGEAFGIDRVADEPKPERVALKIDKKDEIALLNKYEKQLIKKMDKKVKGKYPSTATIKLPQTAVDLIDPELMLTVDIQAQYGMGSKWDRIGWAVQLIQGDELGDRIYTVERPYGTLTFDLNKKTLRLDPGYQDAISGSLTIPVDPDMEKERVLRTTLIRNIMKQAPTRTIPNELLQNSLDAMPDNRPWDQQMITWKVEGNVDTDSGKKSTTISVEDNARGMAPEVFAFSYLKIGAEGKRSDIAKGGLGAANAALLYFPNKVKVSSVGWALERPEYTTLKVRGKERPDVRRWSDGLNEDGTVKEGAVKVRTTFEATREAMFAGIGKREIEGRAAVRLNVERPGEFPADTPTGTKYKATYTDADKDGNLKLSNWALESGFNNYVHELRHKAVIIQTGRRGNPDSIIHTKDFSDIKPEELKEPKFSVRSKGSEVDIYLLDVGPTGAGFWGGGHEIDQKFYNKGLPLQISTDNIADIRKVPFEPDFKILINFRKTPDVDPEKWKPGEEYPFISNRTEVVNEIGAEIAVDINKILDRMSDEFQDAELKDFKQMEDQSKDIEEVTIMNPYRDAADVKEANKILRKHRPFYRDMARAFNVFQELLKEIGLDPINLVLTIDKRLHGWKSNPEAGDIPELYAINPVSVTEAYMQKPAYQTAIDAGVDPDIAKAGNFLFTMMHEYSHRDVSGHGKPFRGAMGDLFALFGDTRYSIIGRELRGIFKKHSKRLGQLEKDLAGLGEGGLLLTVKSGRAKYGEHERGRIKGTSPLDKVSGLFAQSRIQYDLFGEHQKIEEEPRPVTPEDFLKKSFPDASPAQIKAMLKDPELRKQVARGSLSTLLADEISKKYNLAKAVTQIEMFPKEARGQGDLFDLARKDVGESVEEWVDEPDPTGPEGGSLLVRTPKGKPEGEPFESAEEEVQARVEAARGKKPKTLTEEFREIKTRLMNRAFREYEHLPKTKEFAELRNALLRLAKQRGIVNNKTMKKIERIQEGLNKTDQTDFAWKVILDDLMEEVNLQRERGIVDADIGLPYGYTPDTLAKDHADLNRHITGNIEIQAALRRRGELWDSLREDYIKAMKVIGFDVSKFLKREFYFRHQVLNYVTVMGLYGSGERLRTPSYRSHLRPRTASDADINADYLQAEHEVVSQMMYDIEIARTIDAVNRHYNIQDEVKGRALMLNDAKMLTFFGELVKTLDVPPDKEPPTAEDLYRQVLNTKMAIGFDKLGQAAAMEELPVGKEYEWEWLVIELADNWIENKQIKQELGKEWTSADREPLSDEASAELIRYAAWILKEHGGKPGSAAAATIFKGMNEKRQIIQETLGKEYLEWRDIIPEGYRTWQPWEGTTFFMAHSVPETIAKQLIEGELEKIGIGKEDLRQGLMRGGKRREYVLKNEVADTLNQLSMPRVRTTSGNAHAWIIKRWKIWQLVSPRRFGKYNFRNLTGDAEAAFLGSPQIFKHTRVAWNELWEVFVNGKDPAEVSQELADWLDRGGWGATLQAQEMGEFDVAQPFIDRHSKTGAVGVPKKIWDAYWKTARISTDFREALLRYAAYKEALRVMEQSPDGLPKEYWASIPGEIQGLSNIKDRAYWMSNDLLGAYDRVSVLGQELRERWFPFWSWKAVNFMRYVQLWKNAANDGTFTEKVGRAAAGKAAKTPFIAMRIGKFILKALALSAIIKTITGLAFPREEEDLPDEIRGRPHLTFGRDKEGRVQYFPRVGTLGDFAEWFGLDASPYYLSQWYRGRMTLPEIAKDMAKSPVNVVVQGGVPFIKLAFEIATHQALFPDVFKPRTIRDEMEHIARSFGLENEYRALAGKPSRPYYESVPGLLIYTVDPFQAAYRDIMDEKTRYMERVGKYGTGFWLNDRGNALYNARLALRYNDLDAAVKYMAEYIQMGGTLRGLKQSLQRLHPLSGLNKAEKIAFIGNLDARGLAQLVRALKFYEEMMLATPPEVKRATRLRFKGRR
ncbi:MAG: hypothetical protein JSV47_03885 [Deltaproteobacteria bacterium]|nr:MAG: hypothetical protein JSV47_03885 [Deltaproteobacteria bacterium]